MEGLENPKDATRLTLAEVYRLSLDVLSACGATEENASPVARSIELAEADFIRNIGLAVAIPSKGRPPVVIDQSSSVTAKVSIFARRAKGQQLDPGWALDKTGRPTLDPVEALEGSMLPFGGYKGANLALLVEALSSGLTGANWSFKASPFSDNTGGPPRTGQFFIAMRPTVFGCADFPIHIEELFAAILTQKGTQLPCAERLTARQKSAIEGVVVDNELLNRLYSYK